MQQARVAAFIFRKMRMAVVLGAGLAALIAQAVPWTGGRGLGNRNAFPEVTFPPTPAVVWKSFLGKDFMDLTLANSVLTDGMLVVTMGRHLLGLTPETGEVRWHQELPELPVGDILLLDGQLVISHPGGLVTARAPASGEVLWKKELPGGLRNGPVFSETVLFFTTKASTIEGIERKTGKYLGSTDVHDKIEAGPVLLGKSLLLAYYNGLVIRVENGIRKWYVPFPNATISITPVTDGRTVVVTTANTLVALNPYDQTAPVRWQYPAPDRLPESATLDGERLYFATQSGRLHALDLATGKDRWVKTLVTTDKGKQAKQTEYGVRLPAPPVANPVVLGKHLLVRMEYGLLGLLEKETGAVEWLYRLKLPVGQSAPGRLYMGTPVIDGADVYFVGSDGQVYRLSTLAPDVEPPTFSGIMPQVSAKGFLDAKAMLYLGSVVEDEGSGLPPGKFTLRLDSTDLTASLQYDARSGYYYVSPDPQQELAPGMHRLHLQATDYRGNEARFQLPFVLGTKGTGERVPVAILGEFLPKRLKVKPGTIVCWINTSGSPRTIVADQPEFSMELKLSSDRQFPQGIPHGESWCWIVPDDLEDDTPIFYHCRIMGKPGDGTALGTGLVGVIEIVKTLPDTPAGGVAPPPAEDPVLLPPGLLPPP
jgi:outer membrane protein assembly factor BamB